MTIPDIIKYIQEQMINRDSIFKKYNYILTFKLENILFTMTFYNDPLNFKD